MADPSVSDPTRATTATDEGYAAWWSEKPDDYDLTLRQIQAWARMATLPSHVELRPALSCGKWQGWAAFIVRDGGPCRHCGAGPDVDGDHTCPCPNTDAECRVHSGWEGADDRPIGRR